MTSTASDIENRWRALVERAEPDQREVDASSPLRMVLGVAINQMPYLAVITSRKPDLPDLGGSVCVECRRRGDARWVLMLQLRARDLVDAFISLLAEIAGKCGNVPTEEVGLRRFLAILSDWQALLLARRGHISEEKLRGLIAELWFGFQSDAHQQPLSIVVNAWDGALGGCQDYIFPSPDWSYEVKSVRPNSTAVEISSAEQLDGERILLAAVTLHSAAPGQGGITLPDQVRQIREGLPDGSDRAEFNRRFSNLSVDLDDRWYSEQSFSVQRLQLFDVAPAFPAIRRSQLHQAIRRTAYMLDLDMVSDFLILDKQHDLGTFVR